MQSNKDLFGMTEAELLNEAHKLALISLVEQMREGEYVSSGQLSYLNTLSKNNGIKNVKEEATGNDITTKIQELLSPSTDGENTQYKKDV